MNLLALALTAIWRRPLADVLQEHVMGPIGASSTCTWQWHGYDDSWINMNGAQVQVVSGGSHWGGGIVSRSGYYAWLERAPSERAQRDAELTGQIEEIHEGSRRTYGVPRIYAELKDQGQSVGGSGTASARWH